MIPRRLGIWRAGQRCRAGVTNCWRWCRKGYWPLRGHSCRTGKRVLRKLQARRLKRSRRAVPGPAQWRPDLRRSEESIPHPRPPRQAGGWRPGKHRRHRTFPRGNRGKGRKMAALRRPILRAGRRGNRIIRVYRGSCQGLRISMPGRSHAAGLRRRMGRMGAGRPPRPALQTRRCRRWTGRDGAAIRRQIGMAGRRMLLPVTGRPPGLVPLHRGRLVLGARGQPRVGGRTPGRASAQGVRGRELTFRGRRRRRGLKPQGREAARHRGRTGMVSRGQAGIGCGERPRGSCQIRAKVVWGRRRAPGRTLWGGGLTTLGAGHLGRLTGPRRRRACPGMGRLRCGWRQG